MYNGPAGSIRIYFLKFLVYMEILSESFISFLNILP
jgi:hypothetical protein